MQNNWSILVGFFLFVFQRQFLFLYLFNLWSCPGLTISNNKNRIKNSHFSASQFLIYLFRLAGNILTNSMHITLLWKVFPHLGQFAEQLNLCLKRLKASAKNYFQVLPLASWVQVWTYNRYICLDLNYLIIALVLCSGLLSY